MDEEKKKFTYCPVCGKLEPTEIVDVCTSAYGYLIERIKKDHPEWIEKDGACPKCIEYYKKM